MNIVFMGTPEFAATALGVLLDDSSGRFAVPLVVTRPDAASGRGKALLPSPVRVLADAHNIPVLQKNKVDEQLLEAVRALEPDFIVVAAFGLILPQALLDIPRYAAINIHASLLPRWRGAAPIQRAILAGDEYIGASIMRMEAGLDTGDYCASVRTQAAGKNATQLTLELATLGAKELLEQLPCIADGSVSWVEQDAAKVSYADKIAKSELALDPAAQAAENVRRVLASTAQAPARCVIAGRGVTVIAAELLADSACASCAVAAAGSASGSAFMIEQRLTLKCSEGCFAISELKPDGKNVMSAKAFANGILQKGGTSSVNWRSVDVANGHTAGGCHAGRQAVGKQAVGQQPASGHPAGSGGRS